MLIVRYAGEEQGWSTEVKNIRVILAMESGLVCDALHGELQRCDRITVVAQVSSPLELLRRMEIDEADADILITNAQAIIDFLMES